MVDLQTMSCSCALQLFLLVYAVFEAHHASSSPDDPSPSQDTGEVPASHLRMLSGSLAHLLQEVEENTKEMEDQEQQIVKELGLVTTSLESLHKDRTQTVGIHRQVRGDMQTLSVRGDKLWQEIRDLQRGLNGLKSEQGAMQHRTYQILLKIKSLAELSMEGGVQHNIVRAMKMVLEKQTQQLNNLTLEVSAREGAIDKQLKDIDHLEKQVSEGQQ